MTKILLVDDENLILYSLSKTLKHVGAEVASVTNGKDALAEIRRRNYDICFLDVHLPDANGLELMDEIRTASPGTSVIIMTAEELDEQQLQTLQNKGSFFLPKPFDLDRVLALVREISGRKSAAI